MPVPSYRVPVRVARGTLAALTAGLSDLQEGELCYATDENILYVIEGGSLTAATSAVGSIDSLSDVDTSSIAPTDGQVLVWSSTGSEWVPGDQASGGGGTDLNSLTDVSYAGGSLEINALDQVVFSSADVPAGVVSKIYANSVYGTSVGDYASASVSGSFVYVHRDKGVELRAENSEIIRLSGENAQTNNQPELRWESGDATTNTPTGNYLGLKLSAGHTVDQTYILPALDGSGGQVLSTDGSGTLSWASIIDKATLQAEVAAATDFADFQSRIAAL